MNEEEDKKWLKHEHVKGWDNSTTQQSRQSSRGIDESGKKNKVDSHFVCVWIERDREEKLNQLSSPSEHPHIIQYSNNNNDDESRTSQQSWTVALCIGKNNLHIVMEWNILRHWIMDIVNFLKWISLHNSKLEFSFVTCCKILYCDELCMNVDEAEESGRVRKC
jgi:hypothetical protein